MHLPEPNTSQILTLPSRPADSSRWPLAGKKRMALTPFVCPAQVWIQRLGRKANSLSAFLPLGGSSHERPAPSTSALPWNMVFSGILGAAGLALAPSCAAQRMGVTGKDEIAAANTKAGKKPART